MDVVALAQHGVDYAVATLGTATTPIHAQKLFASTDRVVFCFDGDNAGRKAAWRALENTLPVLADGKNAAFLFLPDGEDPDDFVRKRGKAAFEALDRPATPLSEFLLAELSARHPPTSAPRDAPRWSPPRSRCSRDHRPGAGRAAAAAAWPSSPGCPKANCAACCARQPRHRAAPAASTDVRSRPRGTAAEPRADPAGARLRWCGN